MNVLKSLVRKLPPSRSLASSMKELLIQRTSFFSTITNIESKDHMLKVSWENGDFCDYPYIFLRDNCLCPNCLHVDSKGRTVDTLAEVNFNTRPIKTEINDSTVLITWDDDHKSAYPNQWFKDRVFPKTEDEIKAKSIYAIKPVLWNRDIIEKQFPTLEYKDFENDDNGKVKLIESLLTLGFCLVKNAPLKSGITREIGRMIGYTYLRCTPFGETFNVHVEPEANSVAYTSIKLPLHTDLPALTYQPGVQILHCIKNSAPANSSEGASLIADGFYAAEKLKKKNKEAFDLLCNVIFQFYNVGISDLGQFYTKSQRPIIGLDVFGDVRSISNTNFTRSSFVNAPSEVVYEAYKALFQLANEYNSKENKFSFMFEPGDILIMNNQRVLHAREEYDPTITSRFLEGCYLDWDEIMSKYRVLKNYKEIKDYD